MGRCDGLINRVMKEEIYHSDLDLAFNIHPAKKDLVLSVNERAIIRSIKNLVLTNHYERLFQSEIGSNVNKMLFSLLTPLTAGYLQREIYDVIRIFEPRAKNVQVQVNPVDDYNAMNVNIKFSVEVSVAPVEVDILLERVR